MEADEVRQVKTATLFPQTQTTKPSLQVKAVQVKKGRQSLISYLPDPPEHHPAPTLSPSTCGSVCRNPLSIEIRAAGSFYARDGH